MNLKIKRKKMKILRDESRVITRLHIPGQDRIPHIIDRIIRMDEAAAAQLMEKIYTDFSDRHKDIERILKDHYRDVKHFVAADVAVSAMKKLLIGAYFTMEYAIESAALFNPSIVPDPDQTNLPAGSLRFIMSLRATGEGHISSIVFRSGIIDKSNTIFLESASEFVETPHVRVDPVFDRHLFQLKLHEMHAGSDVTAQVLDQLDNQFTYEQLKTCIAHAAADCAEGHNTQPIETMHWLADSNYTIEFDADHAVSERVLFPVSENETSGIEDARFVQFFDDDGKMTYYATYTAYNGVDILPQLIETRDFVSFNIITLNGNAVQNKGMALFPRKINGRYVMLSRQDGENNHIMYSDHLHFWQESQIIQEPSLPWEFIQIGNCGSPIEITQGWLVITHGVGPMRQYCIGAMLLDKNNPSRVIASLKEPLLSPNDEEREGYVPNVVYSCGSCIHNNELILPYAMSDISSGIAVVNISDLIEAMEPV